MDDRKDTDDPGQGARGPRIEGVEQPPGAQPAPVRTDHGQLAESPEEAADDARRQDGDPGGPAPRPTTER
jgi:hypothetical protein